MKVKQQVELVYDTQIEQVTSEESNTLINVVSEFTTVAQRRHPDVRWGMTHQEDTVSFIVTGLTETLKDRLMTEIMDAMIS